ncbi:Hypothetical_protein [Hexamita inflata]|uniref:Hypothetical_protein n=1 Tax=Hexamita inflata TaxID=28002 RepID=A0AA86PL36_9EUKA|nr:Hypothetical protein HINF_LOCUS29660 [Hexamita inflata]
MNWHKSQKILHQQNKVKNNDIHNLDDIIDNLNEHNSVPDTPIAEILGKYKQKHAQTPASQFTLFSSNQLLDNSPIIKKPQIALCLSLNVYLIYRKYSQVIFTTSRMLKQKSKQDLIHCFNLSKSERRKRQKLSWLKIQIKRCKNGSISMGQNQKIKEDIWKKNEHHQLKNSSLRVRRNQNNQSDLQH